MWSPLSLILTPVVLVSFIPLVGFALLTTWIAFAALYVRALAVYFELGLALLRNYLVAPPPRRSQKQAISPIATPKRRRKSHSSARSSNSDLFAYGDIDHPRSPFTSTSLGFQRDFESVGGYNFLDEADDDEQWTALNSGLELPTPFTSRRNHVRSLTTHGLPTLHGSRSPRQTRLMRGGSSASLHGQSLSMATPATYQSNESGDFPKQTDSRLAHSGHIASSSSTTTSSSSSSRGTVLQMKGPI